MATDRASNTPKHAGKRAPEGLRIEVYDVMENVKEGAKRTDSFVRKHPWQSVGIAALAGAFIGRILFGRKRR